jgi:Lon protease-like protein
MPSEPELHDGPIPIFPLPNVVLFPHMVLPLHIFEPRYRQMLEDTMADRDLIGMVKLEPHLPLDEAGDPAIRRIGCVGKLTKVDRLPDGRSNIQLFGVRKFEILEEGKDKPYRTARVRWLVDLNEDARGDVVDELIARNFALLDTLADLQGGPPVSPESIDPEIPFTGILHSQILTANLEADDRQELLEVGDVLRRAERLSELLSARIALRRRLEIWKGLAPDHPGLN